MGPPSYMRSVADRNVVMRYSITKLPASYKFYKVR